MRVRRHNDSTRREPKLGRVDHEMPEISLDALPSLKVRKPRPQKERYEIHLPSIGFKKSVIVLASMMLVISTVIFAADQLLSPDVFEIEELHISANFKQLNPEVIRRVVLPQIQNNYFAIDLKQIEQSVRKISWVDQISVRRRWPRSIYIRMTEQHPVALWGERTYLNTRAEIFEIDQGSNLQNLPYLHGPEGTQLHLLEQFKNWKERLAIKNLELDSLIMTSRHSYEAKVRVSKNEQKRLTQKALPELFKKDRQPMQVIDWRQIEPFYFTINFGKDNVDKRLDRLLSALPDAFNERLLKVNSIDLRYPNGFAVRWNENSLMEDFLQLAVIVDEKI